MLIQRLPLRELTLLFTFVVIIFWNATPSVADKISRYSLFERLAWAGPEDYSVTGHLNSTEGQTTLKLKSETKALRWSLLGTLVPVSAGLGTGILYSGPEDDPAPTLILMGSGLVIGPSLGYFYGGRGDRGMKGILIRVGMEVFFVSAAMIAVEEVGTSGFGDFSNVVAAVIILSVGQGFVLAHGIYDIAKVKSEVRKYNQSLQKTSLMLMPKYFVDSGAPGIQLRIMF
jgi:hypothetical protein